MANAVGYRLRISRNPYFSSIVVDRKVNAADVTVTSLGEGAYYWMVQSYDTAGQGIGGERKEPLHDHSKGQENGRDQLELDPFVQHGHVIEVTGKTEVGARVMVNGREVPMMGRMAVSTTSRRRCPRGKRDHGDSAERQGRSEHPAEKGCDSVKADRADPRGKRTLGQWGEDP